jgi:hypothetical protein
MKQEDFERLKTVCEKEGFEIAKLLSPGNVEMDVFAIANKKDIWEGVEFVESNFSGKIYIKQDVNFEMLRLFKPSTESAYVDQLKKEAFKRYGEIGAIKASTDQIKALTDYSYDMNLQNMNGRENFQEAFKYGISIGIDETLSWIKFNQGNGEIKAPCTGNCGMNYCDDNGCTDRKRHLVGDPIDPQVN